MTPKGDSWAEAEMMVWQRVGPQHRLLGLLEYRVAAHNEVDAIWSGCLPYTLVAQICAALLRECAEDLHSDASLAALRNGKCLTYYVYAPSALVQRALYEHVGLLDATIVNLPLGVCEQSVRVDPPLALVQ